MQFPRASLSLMQRHTMANREALKSAESARSRGVTKCQNVLIDIIAKLALEQTTNEVRASAKYSVIVDETSDISRLEQESICLRYIFKGKKRSLSWGSTRLNQPKD